MHTRPSRNRLATLWLALLIAFPVLHAGDGGTARYVFLFIGDGMGAAQREAATHFLPDGPAGSESTTLVMDRFPVHGLCTTHAQNSPVTDSAAAGTAIACGRKTLCGTIAMDATRTVALPTLAEKARQAGRKVGIVSSVSIDHATPACFYAHAVSRNQYYDIAMQLAASDFDYFGGGAARGNPAQASAQQRDVVAAARQNGFAVVRTRAELDRVVPGRKVWAFNHTVDRKGALYYDMDRPADHLSLAEFTRKGIELLDNPAGFFLMVEGGKIDWACHANDAAAAIRDTLALDRAVAVAYRFYRQRPDETLIVVTADHETGGMAVHNSASTRRLAAQAVSYERFRLRIARWRQRGTPFAEALPQTRALLGFDTLTEAEEAQLATAYAASVTPPKGFLARARAATEGGKDAFLTACRDLSNRRAGITWKSHNHTATPVPTTAIGVSATRFSGEHDNTDFFAILSATLDLGPRESTRGRE